MDGSSVEEEVVLSGSGGHHGLTEHVAELLVILLSVVLDGGDEVLSDGHTVEDHVVFDDLQGSLFTLRNLDKSIEVLPVLGFSVDGLASWESLLNTLDTGKDGDGTTEGIIPVFLLPGLIEHLSSLVESKSSVVHLIDADKEVGQVEFTNVGGFEETLKEFSNVNSFILWISINIGCLLGFLLGDSLDQVTNLLSELLILLSLQEETCGVDVILELRLVFHKVGSHHWHVLEWVLEHFHSSLNSGKVVRDDSLAVWETLLELLVSSKDTDGSSNEITNHVLGGGVMKSLLEGLVSDIKEESSLILLADAKKELVKVEFISERLEETLVELGLLLLLWVLSSHCLVFLRGSKENVSSSLTALLTKAEPFL